MKLYSNTIIFSVIIEGLDGSGKGTYTKEIASLLSKNGYISLVIEFPQYNAPFGSHIKQLLQKQNTELDLSLEERMALYALNRLETLPFITEQLQLLQKQHTPICLIFDRSHFSNVFTCAYYMLKNGVPKNIEREMKRLYEIMVELDAYFISSLALTVTPVCIPMIDPLISLQAIAQDATRDGSDYYEQFDVQQLTNTLYTALAAIRPNVHLIEQMQNGVRLTPEKIARIVVEIMSLPSLKSNFGRSIYLETPTKILKENLLQEPIQEILERKNFHNLKTVFDSYYAEHS